MPIPTSNRNNILSQLDAAFLALEAGTLIDQNLLHSAFQFTTGGRRYVVQLQCDGASVYQHLLVKIKRMPLP